ncbi:MAG TPA: efflux RND transporter periplasmic adaptor subunit [Vicinamibacterales bacterium]|nr:efflux RND transporter periplasmic adaptor subunit [Vicinamibacterales bacterium]
MSDDRRLTLSRKAAALGGVALLLAGAGVTYLAVRANQEESTASAPPSSRAAAPATPVAAPSSDAPLPDMDVTLTEEMVARAGIEVAAAGTSGGADALTIPGVIEADAYRRVVVTALAAGRITRVNAELGQAVKRGATLALIFSPGLAEAQTRYLSMRAELGAAVQEMKRTERLVEIGAASRQELERIRASHTVHATGVEGARAQLALLGMSSAAVARLTAPGQISATISVAAPSDGVVTERQANPGLNVDTSTPLFTVVDLSQVWVQGDLFEKDFPRVRVGSQAMITTTAYPGLALGGRVAYIDPQMNQQTRTARVRVEVPNPRRELRLGMYAEMQIGVQGGQRAVTVARDAVQTIGDRQVVYLARPGQPGRFIEREVRVGDGSGTMVEITSGVNPGDVVVTKGSFFVRAERERLGLRAPGGQASPAGMADMPGMSMGEPAPPPASPNPAPSGVTKIRVGDTGFEPARVEVRKGATVTLEFTRVSENTCATEVMIPSQQVRKKLPLNTPVQVTVRATESGEIAFACGMDMLKGTVVVR